MKIFRIALVCFIFFSILIGGCQKVQPVQTQNTVTPFPSPIPTATDTPTPSRGHASISGRIIEGYSTHRGVMQLPLSIEELSAFTVTDLKGAFTFDDLPEGTWTITGNELSFTVQVETDDQKLDVGLIKYPVEHIPDAYSRQIFPPDDDLYQQMETGEYIDYGTAISHVNWSRPSLSEQQENVWSRNPYNKLPESFLRWWFDQPAVVFNTIDILDQNDSPEYAADPQFSEWRELLGVWDIDLVNDPYFLKTDYNRDFFYKNSYKDIYAGKMIEVWLMDYKVFGAVKSGDHYFLDVYPGHGFNIIRFEGNDGKPFQVHLVQEGQEIARLPQQCFQPGDVDCSQTEQAELPFYPSPTPTLLAYTPQPTPQPPSLDNLQIINRTNASKLVPIWRYEPPENTSTTGSFAFDFSPDGKKIAIVEDHQVLLMDIETNRIVQTFTLDALFSEDSLPALRDVLFSPNGNRLAGYTRAGLVLWDVPTGTLLWKANYSSSTDLFPGSDIDGMTSIKFSPGGDLLVTTSIMAGSDIRVWSARTGKLVKELGRDNQLDAAFSPDGKRLYTADRISAEEAIRIWDTETWLQVGAVSVEAQANSTVLSANGERMIVGSNYMSDGPDKLIIYAVDEWDIVGTIKDRDPVDLMPKTITTYPTLNRDGGIVAFVSRGYFEEQSSKVQLWDTINQQHLVDLEGDFPMSVWTVRFSPDGRLLAAQSENGTTIFWGVPSP